MDITENMMYRIHILNMAVRSLKHEINEEKLDREYIRALLNEINIFNRELQKSFKDF